MITLSELNNRGIVVDCLRVFICPPRPRKDVGPITIGTRGALYIPEDATQRVKDLVTKIIFDTCNQYIGEIFTSLFCLCLYISLL